MTQTPDPDTFITRWAASGAAERANYQLFLSELCDLLGVERPRPATADPAANAYVFEKPVPLAHGTTGFIDLYRRGCFVLEAKQGSAPPHPLGEGGGEGLSSPDPQTLSLTLSHGAREPAPPRPLGEGGGEGLSSPDPQTLSLTLSQGAREPAPRGRKKRGTAVRGTAGWDTALERARAQAQTYARSLPPGEIAGGRPPFLIVVDVGNTIDLYSEFTRSGGNYVPFPDPHHFRLRLDDLRDEASRDLLRAVWDTPLSLDPARRSARVTRAIAERLAELAKTLEQAHDADTVAHFLMRCLFTMFAEDVGLLPEGAFTQLLADLRPDPVGFKPLVEHLWHSMNTGGFSVALRRPILRFNGGLFADPTALPLDGEQIALLIDAARADWRDVEPAIFGTLLERALDPRERHKLGAHYTPRAYVERLVEPTVIAPLRAEWAGVQAAALRHHQRGDDGAALAEVEAFLHRLAHVTVLDPACGSGNFLYVTLEQMKRLEGEALNLLRDLGGAPRLALEGFTVTPQQFRGIEVNPRAAAIAELVLWIGYLQWHRRTRGEVIPAEPIIRDFHNIERRDAVLAWDRVEPLTGAGRPPGDALGRPHDEAPPGHRRTRARRGGPNPGVALRQPAPGGLAGGRLRGRQPAVHRHGADARGARRRLRRGHPRRLPGRARLGRLRDLLVAQGRRAGAGRRAAALRLHRHQQPAPDVQPARAADPPRTASRRCRCCSPSPTTPGWTRPTARRCASP
ncbi:MAG: class I SAM-dependent DNA methyltransferase [Candidatus Promineofilum sp.]|nr:class I SAM-dependent DNA methyltransferase [Promineifilum sp.]